MDDIAQGLRQALSHMQAALNLFDAADYAQEAGAYLDLAIHQLTHHLSQLETEIEGSLVPPLPSERAK
jgi:hypothetical protein